MNLECSELIAEYHQRMNLSNTGEIGMTSDVSKKDQQNNGYGYGRGWAIEKILGATDIYGELMFL